MEKHVCSIEVARKLKDMLPAGFNCEYKMMRSKPSKDNGFYKVFPELDKNWGEWFIITKDPEFSKSWDNEILCRPLLSEMQELLLSWIDAKYWLHIDKAGVHYLDDDFKELKGFLVDDDINLATCATMMYLWLVEERHIEGV